MGNCNDRLVFLCGIFILFLHNGEIFIRVIFGGVINTDQYKLPHIQILFLKVVSVDPLVEFIDILLCEIIPHIPCTVVMVRADI